MSTTIIKIHGGDYANWHFQAFGTPEQTVKEMDEEGVSEKTIETPDGKYTIELLKFGVVDPKFIEFVCSCINEDPNFGIYVI